MATKATKIERNAATALTLEALTTSDKAFEAVEEYIVTGSGTLTIEAGDNPRSAAEPLVLTISGDANVIRIDTAYYMQGTGENRGCVLMKQASSGSIKVAPVR